MPDAKALLDTLRRRDRYHSLRELGQGAVAVVQRVYDSYLGRVVARKELSRAHLHSPQVIQTFLNEAKLIGQLDHPGVIPIFDTFLGDGDVPSYTMREIDGRRLTEVFEADPGTGDGRPLPVERCLDIIGRLCETMAYAHDRGVIHLDLKPDNMMVGDYGEIVIVDWGAARLVDTEVLRARLERFAEGAALPDLSLEEDDLFIGTPKYMSPEQTRDSRANLTGASDIFSIGVIFYQALTGKHPFHADNLEELFERIRSADVTPPLAINPDTPPRVSHICSRMLEKDPGARYGSFHEVLAELAEFRNTGGGFPTRRCEAGEVVFREGEPGEYACSILEGSVEVSVDGRSGHQVLAMLHSGDMFGELSLLAGIPRSATVTCVEPTLLRIIRKSAVDAEMDKLSPWVGELLGALTRRFLERADKVAELESD